MKLVFAVLGFILLLGGCASDPALMDRSATLKYTGPMAAGTGADMRPADWERAQIVKYHAPTDAERDNMTQREFRDSVLYRELSADDDHFGQFIRALRSERAGGNISADLATLILNGLGVVTGGVGTKRTLAALAGGVTGAKGSVEKELFNAEAMTAIVSRMKAARLQALVPIEAGFKQSIGDYPLERGLRDLRAYADAGTLSSTLAAITNDAGEESEEARQDIEVITRGADYVASFQQRSDISGQIRDLSDAQVVSLASAMLTHFGEREQAAQDRINKFHPVATRVSTPQKAKAFLLFWIIQESAPDQLRQWTVEIDAAKKGA